MKKIVKTSVKVYKRVDKEIDICDVCEKEKDDGRFSLTSGLNQETSFEYWPSCCICKRCAGILEVYVAEKLAKMGLIERYGKNEETKLKEIAWLKKIIKQTSKKIKREEDND
jgi:hypothetical protein